MQQAILVARRRRVVLQDTGGGGAPTIPDLEGRLLLENGNDLLLKEGGIGGIQLEQSN